ncbi:MAG: NAD(+)/NADH kinase [Candidatus Aenigmarchaeota archaeon]|nr:NAD(+)/NADH kinase [Candidatus Aenigmarchaeota archaeon]
MQLTNILVVYTTPKTKEQKSTLQAVKNTLKKFNIKRNLANRDKLRKPQFQNKDLIIAVGGDGTFLRAAQFVDSQILFGVNSDIKNKEGFFMKANKNDFERKLKKTMKNRIKIKKLPRLQAYINNKRIETLALNEFFIGPRRSYHAAKYVIEANGNKERQKSSGILVTTPTGSYAWAKSCCSKTLPLNSKNFQFVVREPYEGKVFKNYRLKYGILNKNQKIKIMSEMLDGILIADSVSKEYNLKNRSKATIKMSNNYLNVLWF